MIAAVIHGSGWVCVAVAWLWGVFLGAAIVLRAYDRMGRRG